MLFLGSEVTSQHQYVLTEELWFLLLCFLLCLHFQERFGGATYPLVVFSITAFFLALLRYFRWAWIWVFLQETSQGVERGIRMLHLDAHSFWWFVDNIIRRRRR